MDFWIPSDSWKASCAEFPWMCLEPFDCLNTTGKVETFEELRHQLAKPNGANIQGWCYAGPVFYKKAAQCVNKDKHKDNCVHCKIFDYVVYI